MIWFTLILNKIKPLFSSLKFWLISAILILGSILYIQYKLIKKSEKENERLEHNLNNIGQDLVKSETKSGKLIYSVNALTIKKDELTSYNKELANELKDMKIKTKNVQSILDLHLKYGRTIDTVFSDVLIPEYVEKDLKLNNKKVFQYSFKINDEDSHLSGIMNINYLTDSTAIKNNYKIFDESNFPYLTNVHFKFTDSLTIVPTIEYKRVWLFFRKPIGVKTHVKSNNKYFTLDKMYNYQIVK